MHHSISTWGWYSGIVCYDSLETLVSIEEGFGGDDEVDIVRVARVASSSRLCIIAFVESRKRIGDPLGRGYSIMRSM